jgi:hypothetical protein
LLFVSDGITIRLIGASVNQIAAPTLITEFVG